MAASEGSSMATPKPLNVFFIPWFATGHLIPMVDVARLFASRGVDSTVLVTPANAALVRRTVDGSSLSGHPIRTLLYPFPSAKAGLPPGVENLASLPSKDTYKIDAATPYARPALENLLRVHRPDAVVADVHFGWTALVARDLGIPKLIFHAWASFPSVRWVASANSSPTSMSATTQRPSHPWPSPLHPRSPTRAAGILSPRCQRAVNIRSRKEGGGGQRDGRDRQQFLRNRKRLRGPPVQDEPAAVVVRRAGLPRRQQQQAGAGRARRKRGL
ncbi:scopoletin glucosyltransferase-like [Iris pallida]|uniref:Scopoletin glucosyltransferase-like n=1 Tax=Iris pallida TaxID=29817 RepID=A0AAX6H2H0_IRIPA|nr:scopoletin glucosyltransferase-like [Iris pallida]